MLRRQARPTPLQGDLQLGRGSGQESVVLINREFLLELREVFSPDQFIDRLQKFKEELTTVAPEMRAMLKDCAMDGLRRLAHKYSGAAALFGAVALREALDDIAIAPGLIRTRDIAELIERVEALVGQSVDALEHIKFP